jgi:serine/threonine protein phosphatase PrpC
MRGDAHPLIEWGVACSPLPGQKQSGDLHLVKPSPTGVLVGVVDGLGHGREAAAAAKIAVSHLENYAHEPVFSLVQRCHRALIGTRGAVMSLALFDRTGHFITWIGVGNVLGLLFHVDGRQKPGIDSLIQRGGVVGYQMPPLKPSNVPVLRNDLLILATDGIKRGFVPGLKLDGSPQQVADHILAKHFKGTDDGLVLVARYVGDA